MTKDALVICAGMLLVGLGAWTLWSNPRNAKPAETQVVRALAEDPMLKLVSERRPFMRTER